MIPISKIDDKFSIYKNNIVVLFGIEDSTNQMIDLIRYQNIEIHYICDSNKEYLNKYMRGIKIISPQKLQQLIYQKREKKEFIIQIALKIANEKEISEQLKAIGVNDVITYNEAHKILHLMSFLKLYKSDPNNPILNYREQSNGNQENDIQNLINCGGEVPIFVCQLNKTGDVTLTSTFKENKIPYYFANHTPSVLNNNILKDKKIKITTAIRDPIAQNISMLYQMISEKVHYQNSFNIIKHSDNFFKDGGDAQEWLNYVFTTNFINVPCFSVSNFMNNFKYYILDISKYPFDKEKGYTIIKEGNIEIFVYQLEKMNDVVNEMSEWIGLNNFSEWIRDNEASEKWIANSYKQAQKELKFPKEYFESCYNDPYIQHFYSESDIEKFKSKWKNNIDSSK